MWRRIIVTETYPVLVLNKLNIFSFKQSWPGYDHAGCFQYQKNDFLDLISLNFGAVDSFNKCIRLAATGLMN
jgi:hypothetical protein